MASQKVCTAALAATPQPRFPHKSTFLCWINNQHWLPLIPHRHRPCYTLSLHGIVGSDIQYSTSVTLLESGPSPTSLGKCFV